MYINWLHGYAIIPGLFLVHFLYCSSQNYSGIMCTCKPIPPTNYKNRIGCHMWQLLMLLCMCFWWRTTEPLLCILPIVYLFTWFMVHEAISTGLAIQMISTISVHVQSKKHRAICVVIICISIALFLCVDSQHLSKYKLKFIIMGF